MADGQGTLQANTIADGVYPLPGYARRTFAGSELVATECVLDELSAIVAQYGTLYAWARTQPQARALRGRAPVYVASIPDRQQTTVVVRHVWHGGMLAPFTRDRFRRPTRAPLELLRSHMLRECGIPTPELVGYALYNAGPGLARVDVATRYVPRSNDFAAVLANQVPDISRSEGFDALDILLLQLARNGFIHPDLNIKNILLHKKSLSTQAMVLDVDVMQWNADVPAADIMKRNAARLLRSLLKARHQFGIVFSETEREAFVHRIERIQLNELRALNSVPPQQDGRGH
jgi:Lipopolysaccharide kinase (Kdo/WaaP) family